MADNKYTQGLDLSPQQADAALAAAPQLAGVPRDAAAASVGSLGITTAFTPTPQAPPAAPENKYTQSLDLSPYSPEGFSPTDSSQPTEATRTPAQHVPDSIDDIMEAIRPQKGRIESLEKLDDWWRSPEMNPVGSNPVDALRAIAGTLGASTDDMKDILKDRFNIDAQKQGRYLTWTSPADNKQYAWKPGADRGDFARTIGAGLLAMGATAGAAALVPAGVAASIPTALTGIAAGVGGGLVGASAVEAAKAQAGAHVNWWQLPIGAVLGGAFGAFHGTRPATPGGPAGPSAVSRLLQGTQDVGTSLAGTPIPPVDPAMDALVRAGQAGPGSAPTTAEAATQVGRNQAAAQALEGLEPGLSDRVPPTLLMDPNSQGAAVVQRIRSMGASPIAQVEREASKLVAQVGEDLIGKHGGNLDPAAVNDVVSRSFEAAHAALETGKKASYAAADAIANKSRVLPVALRRFFDELANGVPGKSLGLGGYDKMPAAVRALYEKLGARLPDGRFRDLPTYEFYDMVRKDVGSRFPQGPFSAVGDDIKERLYGALAEDQLAHARRLDARLGTDVAKNYLEGQAQHKAQKGVEKSMTALYGKSAIQDTVNGLQISGNMMPVASAALKRLADGDPSVFKSVLGHIPDALRPSVAMTAIGDLLGGSAAQPANFSTFFKNWSGVLGTQEGRDLVQKTVGQAAFDDMSRFNVFAKQMHELGQLRTSTGNVAADMQRLVDAHKDLLGKVVDLGVIPRVGQLVGGVAGAATGGAAGGAAMGLGGAVTGAGVGAGMGQKAGSAVGRLVQGFLSRGADKDIVPAVEKLILSPEFAGAHKAQALVAAGRPPGPGFIARAISGMVNNRAYNALMDLNGISVPQRALWVRDLINAGAREGVQQTVNATGTKKGFQGGAALYDKEAKN